MRSVAVGAAVVVMVAGCGGHGAASSGPLAQGRKIFASQCSGCHTLIGREHGAVGGDLVLSRLRAKDVASFARVMPTKRPLSLQDARAVARYVVSVASVASGSG